MLYRFRIILCVLCITITLLLVCSVHAYASEPDCQILLGLPDDIFAILTPSGDNYEETARFTGSDYSLAPHQRNIAVQQASDTLSGKTVSIFDLSTSAEFKEKAVIPDVALIRGAAWSPDGQRLLLQDGYNNYLLYLYDLSSAKLEPLFTDFDPGLRVYQVAWNETGSLIAFIGREAPFSETKDTNATTLYILDPITLTYQAVSASDEDVSWYFAGFYWVGSREVAFTNCIRDTQQCQVKIVNLDGETRAAFDGEYWLLGYDERNLLLAINQAAVREWSNEASLVTIDVQRERMITVFELPIDPATPLPIFNISPDFSYLSYVKPSGNLIVVSLANSVDYPIPQTTYDAGAWSPDNRHLLFHVGSSLYIYDLQQHNSRLVYNTAQGNDEFYERWLCVSDDF